jgi:hypothetical protein
MNNQFSVSGFKGTVLSLVRIIDGYKIQKSFDAGERFPVN